MFGWIVGQMSPNQYPPDSGWEPFNNYSISGDWDDGDWNEVFEQVRAKRVSISSHDGWAHLKRGSNEGHFMNNAGGAKMAQEFLEGIW